MTHRQLNEAAGGENLPLAQPPSVFGSLILCKQLHQSCFSSREPATDRIRPARPFRVGSKVTPQAAVVIFEFRSHMQSSICKSTELFHAFSVELRKIKHISSILSKCLLIVHISTAFGALRHGRLLYAEQQVPVFPDNHVNPLFRARLHWIFPEPLQFGPHRFS